MAFLRTRRSQNRNTLGHGLVCLLISDFCLPFGIFGFFFHLSIDNTPHTDDANVSFDIHDALLGNLTELLKRFFPSVPVYATFGNHDYFPHNQFPAGGNLLYNRSFERWKDWIGEDSRETFLKGGYYTLKTIKGLRIVGLNTNLYYTSNKQANNSYPDDPADQLSWLKTVLTSARANNEQVLITGHISPGIIPTSNVSWIYERINSELNGILIQFSDLIVGMHFGHEHSDNFRVHYNSEGQPAIVQFCAPSVTPWRYKLSSGIVGPAHNPSFRLLKYNRTTSNLLDFTQYYMDLPEVNMNNVSEWKIEYNATIAYGLSDLSPRSLAYLVARMKDQQSTEFQSFYRFWTVSVDQQYQQSCDKKCHARFYCNFRYVNTTEFQNCLRELTVSAGSKLSAIVLPRYIFAVLLVALSAKMLL